MIILREYKNETYVNIYIYTHTYCVDATTFGIDAGRRDAGARREARDVGIKSYKWDYVFLVVRQLARAFSSDADIFETCGVRKLVDLGRVYT